MSEEIVAEKPAKRVTEYTTVEMGDGRKVEFAGKRKLSKEVMIDREAKTVALRLDFRNGETRTVVPHEDLVLDLIGHGLSQKIGDEAAGEENVDDMVLAIDNAVERHAAGSWSTRKEGEGAGGSFSGASVVIRAIMEATGRDQPTVKAFLDKKLAEAEAKGEKLTRQALYTSFRNPESKTGKIIQRLEAEKAQKNSKLNADAEVAELAAME
jgi:hypothetical protein